MEFLDQIIHGECPQAMSIIPDNFIDLIVTSPPYNVNLGNNAYKKDAYNTYDDNKEHPEYLEWLKNILKECYRTLKVGGRICVNVPDTSGGKIPLHSDVTQMMMNELGYLMMTTIIWYKQVVGNRTAWGSWLSPSSPSFILPCEYIIVMCKESRKLIDSGETDLYKEEFIDWTLGMWSMQPATDMMNKYQHPAMFPEELPKRCMKMFSWKNSVVMDPFSGAGTTCKVARELGRKYIGFEMDEKYVKISRMRVGSATLNLL